MILIRGNLLSWRLPFAAMLTGMLAFSTAANAQPDAAKPGSEQSIPVLPLEQSASRGITTRDPSSIVKCKDEYWVFYTGRGVPSYRSRDLVKWERGPAVFKAAPEWIAKIVPENRNMQYWAPDIMKLGDRYLLYYSVSSFGKMTSAIGLATNPTLDPDDPAYHWTDQGLVVRTQDGDGYNAIDPSVFHDSDGSLWLTFGSYWSGIKLIQTGSADRQTNGPGFEAGFPSLTMSQSKLRICAGMTTIIICL